jgi:gluconokinase
MAIPVRFLIVMGVSGCGKTTIGRMVADHLGWDFYDADDFHPPQNISKMASGIPLTDADREPWLDALRTQIAICLAGSRPGILACSALKEKYRQRLVNSDPGIRVVYLRGSFETIWGRMSQRPGHYMKPNMLQSQFEALEEPEEALVVDVEKAPGLICDEILKNMVSSQ